MRRKLLKSEFLDLVKVDGTGQEYRESMPRWLAEIAMGRLSAEEPEVAYARIEPIQANRWAPYPAKPATPQQIWRAALALAGFLPPRLVG